MTEKKGLSTQDFVLGSLIGVAVGAVAALLLAPKSGRELRSDINEQVGTIKEKAVDYKEVALEKSAEFTDYAKVQTGVIKEQTARLTDTVKTKAVEVTDAAKKYGVKIKSSSVDTAAKKTEDIAVLTHEVKTELADKATTATAKVSDVAEVAATEATKVKKTAKKAVEKIANEATK